MTALTLQEVRRRALMRLVPPARTKLSTWIEAEMRLPAGVADTPGRVKLWPFQVGIADAFSDPDLERITLVKPARVGFTTLLTGVTLNYVANDPSPIGIYLPTEDDCRGYMVSDVEPIAEATPAVKGLLTGEQDDQGRTTILHRNFPGGSLKLLAAKSPRNFRRHNLRILLMDEVDAMLPTVEGDPLPLAEKRTISFRDRKIIIGSTPVHAETSNVLRTYERSDKRVYECPCPACGVLSEIRWPDIEWRKKLADGSVVWGRVETSGPVTHEPKTASWRCPHCRELIPESEKAGMVRAGQWRATAPDVQGHAGFRLSALISLLPNVTWAHLAQEWVEAKSPEARQVFVNTHLGEGWKDEGEELDATGLKGRVEEFGLGQPREDGTAPRPVPREALLLTAGIDVQHDRIETTFLGHGRPITMDTYELPQLFVLGHEVVWGDPEDAATWADLDELLKRKYRHPLGGELRVTAAVVDAGNWQDQVTEFCFPRAGRRIMAGKGMSGFARPALAPSKGKVKTKSGLVGRLHLVGVDVLKQRTFARLGIQQAVRFSADLLEEHPDYFDEFTGERRVVRYVSGQPVHKFERKSRSQPVEKLDCFVYAQAAREPVAVSWDALEAKLTVAGTPAEKPKFASFANLAKALHR